MKYSYDDYKYLSSLDCIKLDDITWCVDYKTNCLYKIDDKSQKIQFIANLTVGEYREAQYSFMLCAKEQIIILPQNCYTVCVYNYVTNQVRKIAIPNKSTSIGYGAVGGVIIDNEVYFYSGEKRNAPYKINLTNATIEENRVCKNFFEENEWIPDKAMLNSVGCCENSIILGIYGTNKIILFDTKHNTLETINIQDDFEIGKIFVQPGSSEAWIFEKQGGKCVKWNIRKEEIVYFETDLLTKDNSIIAAIFNGNEIILLPRYGEQIIRYEIEEKLFSALQWDSAKVMNRYPNSKRWFFKGEIDNGCLCCYLYKNGGRIAIDMQNGNTSYDELDIDCSKSGKEILCENFWESLHDIEIDVRENLYPLEYFIEKIDLNCANNVKTNSNGYRIWECIRKEV